MARRRQCQAQMALSGTGLADQEHISLAGRLAGPRSTDSRTRGVRNTGSKPSPGDLSPSARVVATHRIGWALRGSEVTRTCAREGVQPRRHPARVCEVAALADEDRLGLDDVVLDPARHSHHLVDPAQTRVFDAEVNDQIDRARDRGYDEPGRNVLRRQHEKGSVGDRMSLGNNQRPSRPRTNGPCGRRWGPPTVIGRGISKPNIRGESSP